MDEILIEEKKYVSSKQAAKITGYAKDYIGQLCREGRVPARLVGRSWYVLESAIQDHRFGTPESEPESVPVQPEGFPRYEASPADIFPTLHRSSETVLEDAVPHEDPIKSINESWKEWFETIAPTRETVSESRYIAIEREVESEETEPVIEPVVADEPVEVPFHAMEMRIPDPIYTDERPVRESAQMSNGDRTRKLTRTIQSVGVVVAAIFVLLACLGSGYFDANILSNSQVFILSGGINYNK
ncbi:MAG: helix-turn-helix domain-containing protein [Candidatus Paceibacteria bacterium]